MYPLPHNQKVYQGVLQQIREYIETNELKPGDKLPSERELSESMQAGRSSIREALRALELLGLIETRSGEGTYLSNYRPYQTMELLASFILNEATAKKELMNTKKLIEKEVAKQAFYHLDSKHLSELEGIISRSSSLKEKHQTFFHYLFTMIDNQFLARIWGLMEDFSAHISNYTYSEQFYRTLLNVYEHKKYSRIEGLFMKEMDNGKI